MFYWYENALLSSTAPIPNGYKGKYKIRWATMNNMAERWAGSWILGVPPMTVARRCRCFSQTVAGVFHLQLTFAILFSYFTSQSCALVPGTSQLST
ncbi:MAG: hypothetical protein R2828_19440 [Saprospiraceae bacterium]